MTTHEYSAAAKVRVLTIMLICCCSNVQDLRLLFLFLRFFISSLYERVVRFFLPSAKRLQNTDQLQNISNISRMFPAQEANPNREALNSSPTGVG